MHRISVYKRWPLLLSAVVVVLMAGAASWRAGTAFQDKPPEDFPDPTSALLPPVVSEEEWYEYDKAETEKILPELEIGDPIEFFGPESEPGGTISIESGVHQLPPTMYIGRFELSTFCAEDPHGVCSLTPFYVLHRVGAETTPPDDGEVVISSRGQRAWFFPSLHPDHRQEVHDAYIDFVQSIGIKEIEDHGYVEPFTGPVEGQK